MSIPIHVISDTVSRKLTMFAQSVSSLGEGGRARTSSCWTFSHSLSISSARSHVTLLAGPTTPLHFTNNHAIIALYHTP